MGTDSVFAGRLRLPLIAAPMMRVSGCELVSAACRNGVIGAFPTANARTTEGLDAWLTRIAEDCRRVEGPTAPVCPNLIMRSDPGQLAEDVAVLVRHRVEMVVASVGSPERVIGPLQEVGCRVFVDVASLRHAEKALELGADGLVLLSAGAGGNTGWVNGLAFIRALRAFYTGPLVLSGGISDGAALWAARAAGCDLAMMGTRFIATAESLAIDDYKQMLVDSRIDDIMQSRAFTGLASNILRPSIVRAGLDPDALDGNVTPEVARERYGARLGDPNAPRRWVDVWGAGHTVSAVDSVPGATALIDEIEREYRAAQAASLELLAAELGGAARTGRVSGV